MVIITRRSKGDLEQYVTHKRRKLKIKSIKIVETDLFSKHRRIIELREMHNDAWILSR